MSPRESASWVSIHTSSESIWYPMVTTSIHSKTYIKCAQIHKSIQSDKNEISMVKLNSSQRDREGKTPYDSTTLTKPAIHQDRDISRTRESESEIKHITTGTNPQPRGWTTPSSSWWWPGWWRWPPEMIPPSCRVPKQGLDWISWIQRPCGGGM